MRFAPVRGRPIVAVRVYPAGAAGTLPAEGAGLLVDDDHGNAMPLALIVRSRDGGARSHCSGPDHQQGPVQSDPLLLDHAVDDPLRP